MASKEDKARAEQLVAESVKLIDAKDWQGLIALMNGAIRLDPENADAWNNRGFAKIQLGQHIEAIKDLDKAIELNKRDSKAWINRGSAKNKLGQHEEAIKDLDKAIELTPQYPAAWNNRGSAKGNLGQYIEAIKDFNKAIELDENNTDAWNNLGWAHFHLSQYEEAIEDFNKALELNPTDGDAARGLLASRQQLSLMEAVKKLEDATRRDVDTLIGNADKLEKREKKAKGSIRWLNCFIFLAWALMAVIIFLFFEKFIWPVLDSPPSCDQTCILKNLLHFPTLLMLIFPFIWGIRILMAAREKQEILREDYYRRALIEATLQHVFDPLTPSDDTPGLKKQNRKVWAKYISRWSENSPAEMMLQYLSKDKRSASSNAHPTEIVFNQCKEAVTKKPDGSA